MGLHTVKNRREYLLHKQSQAEQMGADSLNLYSLQSGFVSIIQATKECIFVQLDAATS